MPDERNFDRGGRGAPPRLGGRPGFLPPHPLLLALDADRDGSISPGEIKKAAQALRTLDRNQDGILSGQELHPPRGRRGGPPAPPGFDAEDRGAAAGRPPLGPPPDEPGPRGSRPGGMEGRGPGGAPFPPPPFLHELDLDRDGELSAAEIAGASKSLMTLDRDQDGTLSRDEFHPGPGGPPGEPPRGPRPGRRPPPDQPPPSDPPGGGPAGAP